MPPSPHPTAAPPEAAASGLTPTVAEIDLDALRHNVHVVRERLEGADLMAVVKADAYGHGAVRIAEALQDMGVRRFAVARVPEALELRRAGLDAPILVFAPPRPEHLETYARHRLEAAVSSPAAVEAAIQAAHPDRPLRVHAQIDTGMNRLGLPPAEAPAAVRRLRGAPGVELVGCFTHFASAGAPEGVPFARTQLERFEAAARDLQGTGVPLHAANSGALWTLPASVRSFRPTLARVGLALYGLAPSAAIAAEAGLRPVMRLVSRVVDVTTVEAGATVSYGRTWRADRPTRLAVVGAGYADGYPHRASHRAEVSIRGRRFPVAGAVCMDLLVVALGPVSASGTGAEVEVGDAVVLFGPGASAPSTREVARWAGTIPYEICCSISRRVPRRYCS